MAPMTPEAKAKLLARLAAGRTKTKAARDAAKAAGGVDPKPRKPRAKKVKVTEDKKEALADPLSIAPKRETIPGIDAPVASSKNVVATKPVDPEPSMTSHIDVPNLPEKSKLKKIVKKAEKLPEEKQSHGLSSTGKPSRINDNELIVNQETGMMALETMLPGQKESIKKMVRKNKKSDPVAPVANPNPHDKTVEKVEHHVPDIASVEGRKPFSFSTVRKMLYQ
jgi:hypothetical protein